MVKGFKVFPPPKKKHLEIYQKKISKRFLTSEFLRGADYIRKNEEFFWIGF
jgi:hypothetical protein